MRSCFSTWRFALIWAVMSATATFAPLAAAPDVVSDINAVRSTTCRPRVPGAALQTNPALDRAAERVARGAKAEEAVLAAGYVARRVGSIHLQGYDAGRLKDGLARASCGLIGDPAFHDVGVAWVGDRVWLILAAARGVPGDAEGVRQRVLRLVNDARSQPRSCGRQRFAAAEPVRLNPKLDRAALRHARDMAAHSFMEHEGHDKSTPADRVTAAGYRWAVVGENVAAGAGTSEEVMADWLKSPGHCANIMGAEYTELGIAFAVTTRDKYGIYWAMSLASPR